MAREMPVTRRTAIKTIAAAAGTGSAITTASAATGESADPSESDTHQVGSGVYAGTVDRIVDGQHVVILVTDGEQDVDQVVQSRESLPNVEEGDAVGVWYVHGTTVYVWPR